MGAWIDHVQVAIPAGAEAACDRFYVEGLGFALEQKPPALAARGGRWYRREGAAIHLGVDPDFRPAKKAHPALVLGDYDAVVARLEASGHATRPDAEVPGVVRCYVDDPVGNRLELIRADEG
ncbi:MAG TPA: VOC family protein [Acidimicrobiales bacterium]|nr:MAG: glyoxalase [Actinobacteria bacterium 21-73-9]HQU26544.1 VOC family protein [Acidimicrobiales bacterium]